MNTPVQNQHSLASQFAAIEVRAQTWSFETLYNWAMNATLIANRHGALSRTSFDRWSSQVITATQAGAVALYELLLTWMWNGILYNEKQLGTL